MRLALAAAVRGQKGLIRDRLQRVTDELLKLDSGDEDTLPARLALHGERDALLSLTATRTIDAVRFASSSRQWYVELRRAEDRELEETIHVLWSRVFSERLNPENFRRRQREATR